MAELSDPIAAATSSSDRLLSVPFSPQFLPLYLEFLPRTKKSEIYNMAAHLNPLDTIGAGAVPYSDFC